MQSRLGHAAVPNCADFVTFERRTRTKPEDRLVERRDQTAAVSVQEDPDERASEHVCGRVAPPAQLVQQVGALAAVLAEQDRGAKGRRPKSVLPAERGAERRAQLLASERLRLEDRELPAVERLAQPRVVVREREE